MNVKNILTIYDINRSYQPGCIVVTHENDINTRIIEVSFRQNMSPLHISQDCIAKASFVERNTNILINDNVACEITDSGHVLIPVDNLHRQGRFDMEIEVTLTGNDGKKVFVTPVPLLLTVNPSILSDAVISDNSKGTIPDLIREAAEALKEAKNYNALNNKPSVNGVTLIGDKNTSDLHIEGGSDIASGTVNTDGTITFRDKDGTVLFTTDGESVIGKKGDSYILTEADKTEIAVKASGMIIVPTKTSQLTNDSGFLTSHQDVSGKENTVNKKTSISNQSQTGDSDTNYPTIGAVRDFVNLVKYDLEDYVDEEIGNIPGVSVDSAFSQTSTNPVQNKIVTAKFNEVIGGKADKSATYTKSEVDTAIENAMSATVPMVVTYADGTTETLNIVTQQEAS